APEPVEAAPTAPAPAEPTLPAGRVVTIVLSEPPARQYGAATGADSDRHYADLVRDLSGGRAEYDPNLARAARELAYQSTEFGEVVPSDVRSFAIASAGAFAADSTFQQVRTNDDGPGPLRQAIQALVADADDKEGPMRLGVGEVYRHGMTLPRHVGAVGTHLGVALDPMPVRVEPGQSWSVRGRLRVPWRDLKALVLQGNQQSELPVVVRGDAIAVEVVAGSHQGPLDVQLVGDGPAGPGKLVQVRAWVGRDPPDRMTARVPPDERGQSATQAEALALQLLNADRARHGKAALGWDARLADIARAHSLDMQRNGFFGHQSPRTGLPTDRLRAAGYLAATHAENVAHNSTVFEAEEGLMHSLGHRKNILADEPSHVGIGIAVQDDGKRRRLWLTQLFAKPALALDPGQVEAQVTERVQKARAAAGLAPLEVDGALVAVARETAAAARPDAFSGVAQAASQAAKDRDLFTGSLSSVAALTADPDHMNLPPAATAPEATKLAVGVARGADSAQFAIVVMILK
ncbi:MAG: CAP domain-containing protein, partial [Deltaproteobacteria bacterium]|nr:CAP domain-containing protein [Deltaproteobacteria bacterium]